MRPLDRIDCEILRHLQNDARTPNKVLAARVGLAPSSCLERVRRLERDGVLRGSRAILDPKRIGIGLEALVAVRFGAQTRERVRSFRDHLLKAPEVVEVFYLAGANDFILRVAVRDADHLRELVLDTVTGFPGVGHVETSLIFERSSRRPLPILVDPEE